MSILFEARGTNHRLRRWRSLVGNSAYPTDKITVNSFDYRPLGLGFANLGALLMARGLAV